MTITGEGDEVAEEGVGGIGGAGGNAVVIAWVDDVGAIDGTLSGEGVGNPIGGGRGAFTDGTVLGDNHGLWVSGDASVLKQEGGSSKDSEAVEGNGAKGDHDG